jgi:predicted nuclease with TOPRIM domain
MNNILFIVLILAILYYYYHHQKKLALTQSTRPLTHTQSTQTDPDPSLTQLKTKYSEINTKHDDLLKFSQKFLKQVGYNSYQDLEAGVKEMKSKITDLQKETRELAKRPLKPTNSKGTQKDDGELEKNLDELIKSIQELNNQI